METREENYKCLGASRNFLLATSNFLDYSTKEVEILISTFLNSTNKYCCVLKKFLRLEVFEKLALSFWAEGQKN